MRRAEPMSSAPGIAVVGAGVAGCAVALELARRGGRVTVLEAEPEPGLQASGTNSGIVHTGFDSVPGELETEMILRGGELRDPVLEALQVPVRRCGAVMTPRDERERESVAALARNARENGVEARLRDDGSLDVPGEAITDPVAYTGALAAAAARHGAELRFGVAVRSASDLGFELVVNCAGLGAARVARLLGDESFDVYPRKGEFLVFEPHAAALERIMLPVPSRRTKGVLVFPTLDDKVVVGPTAVDQEDPDDWSVRPQAADELLPKAVAMCPQLEGETPIGSYAGLRPAGRDANYVIGPSPACDRLVNVAAIRSTGLTASLGIAEYVANVIADLGVELTDPEPLSPADSPPDAGAWWRRTAEHRARIGETPGT